MTEPKRCFWVTPNCRLYEDYHDLEWAVPVYDDNKHFEFLILEAAQAGLSWLTILKRREGYRKAFANFDPKKVASFTEQKIQELMLDPSIIRNQKKIRSAVNNAKLFLEIQKEFGSFSNYIWRFVGNAPLQNKRKQPADLPAQTRESEALYKDLKKRGFSFLGPKILYAHMQATGLVNDHMEDCFCYKKTY